MNMPDPLLLFVGFGLIFVGLGIYALFPHHPEQH
jgi:hypothetical protein